MAEHSSILAFLLLFHWSPRDEDRGNEDKGEGLGVREVKDNQVGDREQSKSEGIEIDNGRDSEQVEEVLDVGDEELDVDEQPDNDNASDIKLLDSVVSH